MFELQPFLRSLITAPGLSGYEHQVRPLIEEAWRPLVDELTVSRIGSLQGLRKGSAPPPRPSILLAGHMDAIGLMVTGIEQGFLRFTRVGGVDRRILPGQRVTVHGREALPAVIAMPSARQLPPELADSPVGMEYLFVDTGLAPRQVEKLVRIGDLISFAQEPLELTGDALAGHTMDDRVAVAAITVALDELQHLRHSWDVWAVATVQEEETLGGAQTSTFGLHPTAAVAIDVTFAKGPGTSDNNTFALGKGITLAWGPNIHPALFNKFKGIADQLEIPYKVELAPRYTGTDAYATQVAAEGVPSLVIGIPLRYMHTPVETVGLKDITRAGRLIAEVIARLEPDFSMNWDKEANETKK